MASEIFGVDVCANPLLTLKPWPTLTICVFWCWFSSKGLTYRYGSCTLSSFQNPCCFAEPQPTNPACEVDFRFVLPKVHIFCFTALGLDPSLSVKYTSANNTVYESCRAWQTWSHGNTKVTLLHSEVIWSHDCPARSASWFQVANFVS